MKGAELARLYPHTVTAYRTKPAADGQEGRAFEMAAEGGDQDAEGDGIRAVHALRR